MEYSLIKPSANPEIFGFLFFRLLPWYGKMRTKKICIFMLHMVFMLQSFSVKKI